MQNQSTITINGREITVKEMTVRQVLTVKNEIANKNLTDTFDHLLPLLTDVSADELLDFTPSGLRALYEKVKEVNADFFTVVPLDKILAGLGNQISELIMQSLSAQSVDLFQPVTVNQPGTTDGAFS
jgi:hypothetical protein